MIRKIISFGLLLIPAFVFAQQSSDLSKVEALMIDSRYEEAIQLIETSIGNSSNPVFLNIKKAEALIKLGKLADGESLLKKIETSLTGDKKALYDVARVSYLLDASQGDGGPDDFIHTQNFALVDKYKHIRGYYDGTNHQEMLKLIEDIEILLKEY